MVWAIILQVVGLDEAPEIPWANWYTVPLRLATLKGGCWGDPAAPTMVARIPFPPEAGPDPLAEQPIFMLLPGSRSEEHTSELQSHSDLVCRLLLEKKKTDNYI